MKSPGSLWFLHVRSCSVATVGHHLSASLTFVFQVSNKLVLPGVLPNKHAVNWNVQLVVHKGSKGLLGCHYYTTPREGCARCEPAKATIPFHSRFTAVLAPSERCCRCTVAHLKETLDCLRDVIISTAPAVNKLTSAYVKCRATDVPKGLTVQCRPTGAKSIIELRPRKACGFAEYFAAGGESLLLGHCFLTGQRRNDTSGVTTLPRHLLEPDRAVLLPSKAHFQPVWVLEEVQPHHETTKGRH